MEQETTYEELRRDYGYLLSFSDLARATSFSPAPFKKWLIEKRLPFNSALYDGRRRVHVRDAAKWIDEGGAAAPKKRRRGRPTASQVYRKSQEQDNAVS